MGRKTEQEQNGNVLAGASGWRLLSVEVKKVVLCHLGPSAVGVARVSAATPANARQGRPSENPAPLPPAVEGPVAFGICSLSGLCNCN